MSCFTLAVIRYFKVWYKKLLKALKEKIYQLHVKLFQAKNIQYGKTQKILKSQNTWYIWNCKYISSKCRMLNFSREFFGVSVEALDPTVFPVCHTQLSQMGHKSQAVRNTELSWFRIAPWRCYKAKKKKERKKETIIKSLRHALYEISQSQTL